MCCGSRLSSLPLNLSSRNKTFSLNTQNYDLDKDFHEVLFTRNPEISRSVAKQQEIKYIEAKFISRSEWVIDVLFIVWKRRLGCGCMWETIELRKDKERPGRERGFYLASTYGDITTQASGTVQTMLEYSQLKPDYTRTYPQSNQNTSTENVWVSNNFFERIDALYRKHSGSIASQFFLYRSCQRTLLKQGMLGMCATRRRSAS